MQGPMLVLTYRVVGAGALVLPEVAAPERADNLWKTTCFELFAGFSKSSYREFNFSPSTRWASYDFSDYREGGGNAAVPTPPMIAVSHEGEDAICTVSLPHALIDGATAIGLTAVIAETGGHPSYWALAHDGPRPDFHKRSCFTLAIGAAEAP
jgi:hypothetical protein